MCISNSDIYQHVDKPEQDVSLLKDCNCWVCDNFMRGPAVVCRFGFLFTATKIWTHFCSVRLVCLVCKQVTFSGHAHLVKKKAPLWLLYLSVGPRSVETNSSLSVCRSVASECAALPTDHKSSHLPTKWHSVADWAEEWLMQSMWLLMSTIKTTINENRLYNTSLYLVQFYSNIKLTRSIIQGF